MQARAFVRNHSFTVGQPASFDTRDPAPSAVEYLLAAIGGCLAVGFQWRASQHGIEVRNLEVSLQCQLEALQALPAEVQLGFGAVNPRTIEVESPEQVASRVSRLAELIAPERIYLNPDCGFGTFADRPVGTPDVAFKKLSVLSQAAGLLRAAV